MTYKDIYDSAKSNPEAYWLDQARAIDWVTPPTRALNDDNAPQYAWFSDAQVNTCYNAVDRHVKNGRGDQTAIIYDSSRLRGRFGRSSRLYSIHIRHHRRAQGRGAPDSGASCGAAMDHEIHL